MPLSPPVARRILRHTRHLHVDAFARDDGLWDLDAQITDTKTRDIVLGADVRRAGTAIHDLKLRLTIDAALTTTVTSPGSQLVGLSTSQIW